MVLLSLLKMQRTNYLLLQQIQPISGIEKQMRMELLLITGMADC